MIVQNVSSSDLYYLSSLIQKQISLWMNENDLLWNTSPGLFNLFGVPSYVNTAYHISQKQEVLVHRYFFKISSRFNKILLLCLKLIK